MKRDAYDERIGALLERLGELQEQVSLKAGLEVPVTAAVLQELANTVEELQVADEELREANTSLVLSRQRYRELFDFAPDAYLVTNNDGIILNANHAAAALLRTPREDLETKPLTRYLAHGGREACYQLMAEAVRQRRVQDRDLAIETESGSVIPTACSIMALEQGGRAVGLLWLIRDIQERREAEARVGAALEQERRTRQALEAAQHDLFNTEERFHIALGATPVSVFQQDTDLRFTWIYASTPGSDVNQDVGKTERELFSAEDADHLTEIKRSVIESGIGTRTEVPIQRPDGLHYYDVSLEPLRDGDGRIVGLTGAALDITERRRERDWLEKMNSQLEDAVAERTMELQDANARLRRLTRQAVLRQEEERRLVSRELHDEAGQALTALKMSLDMIREELPQEMEPLRCRLDEVISVAGKTLEDIRTLAQDLHPPALDNVNLDAALEGLCHSFARLSVIETDCAGMSLPETDAEIKLSLYRFLQEALANVVRHAQAHRASIRWGVKRNEMFVSVEDDGKGFDREAQLAEPSPANGLGLVGMHERLRMVGGWLDIDSEPGRGTRLVAHVPFKGD